MAPHVKFWIVARGIKIGLNTRLYFSDEDEADALDPVLKRIEQPSRRKRLIAQREQRDSNVVYKFDIYLRRERETVFFDV